MCVSEPWCTNHLQPGQERSLTNECLGWVRAHNITRCSDHGCVDLELQPLDVTRWWPRFRPSSKLQCWAWSKVKVDTVRDDIDRAKMWLFGIFKRVSIVCLLSMQAFPFFIHLTCEKMPGESNNYMGRCSNASSVWEAIKVLVGVEEMKGTTKNNVTKRHVSRLSRIWRCLTSKCCFNNLMHTVPFLSQALIHTHEWVLREFRRKAQPKLTPQLFRNLSFRWSK